MSRKHRHLAIGAILFRKMALWMSTWFFVLTTTVLLPSVAIADVLPPIAERAPLPVPHFPNRLYAVVWRNWGLIEPDRLASVLGTTPDRVRDLAVSMGLAREVQVPPEMLRRGYITIIRRNWHLLPYEQLVELLSLTSEKLAFTLREDDFLYLKLGPKPKCEPLKYVQPTEEVRHRAAAIKQLVQQQFGERLKLPQEPRFGFVSRLSQLSKTTTPELIPPVQTTDGPRFIYSYFALFGDPLSNPELDPYPDGLLARLKERGVNGVWMHVVLRQLAPGGPQFPEWGEGWEQRLANLRQLVDRAKRYGIAVYLYMNEPRAMPKAFFENRPDLAGTSERDYTAVCTSNPKVRTWLSNSLAHVFREVPDLGGIFTITASENLTNCASRWRKDDCPRCKHRTDAEIIAEVNAAMEEGVHRAAPKAKVILYDWGWNNHGEAPEIIAKLPKSVWLMSVSEWSLPIERGGIKSLVGEYSMSAVGPGPRATRHWQLAKDQGLKSIAKVQLNNTWELSTVPYLPVMDLVAEHGSRLAKAGSEGFMLSWSLGGYPSLNLELAHQFSQLPAPDTETALQTIAERHFGGQAAPRVRRAWTQFSRAFQEFPYHAAVLYCGPQHQGPANVLYAEPTGYSSTMVNLPNDDLKGWCGPYPPDVLARQFEKVAEGWGQGLADLEAAQAFVPDHLRREAQADLRVAQAAQIHFSSSANQTRFILARDKLSTVTDSPEQERLRRKLISLLDQEIDLARRLFELASVDSRLGYEASNHYFYVPLDLMEKVINCIHLREQYDVAQ